MNPEIDRNNRCCAVEFVGRCTEERLKRMILDESGTERDFSLLEAPVPVHDETRFKVVGDGKNMIVGIALFDSLEFITRGRNESPQDAVEILFNLRNDQLGYDQFILSPVSKDFSAVGNSPHRDDEICRDVQINRFNPYPDAATSCAFELKLKKFKWSRQELSPCPITRTRIHWLFIRFAMEEVFRFSDQVGFNVVRNRKIIDEFSSWNYCSGNGSCDSTGMGRLFRDRRAMHPAKQRPTIRRNNDHAKFELSVLYDTPMSMISGPLGPEMLRKQFNIWRQLGLTRVHWIDYGHWPSFWFTENHHWRENAKTSFSLCGGNLLREAVKAAHKAGLSFVGDLKTFDLGFNCFIEKKAELEGTVRDLDNRSICVCPEIAAHQDWTMQRNPAWRRTTRFPMTRIRLYSLDPIPEIAREELQLYTSADNITYRQYRKKIRIAQGTVRRANRRWTPAGLEMVAGTRKNWFIELDGLELRDPYFSLEISRDNLFLLQQGFMVAEVYGEENSPAEFTVATKGNSKSGFFFWKGWQGWNNTTEAFLQKRLFSLSHFGLVFREMPNMPSLLEPGYEGARRVWLDRIVKMLENGVDGVSIRSYCHHNGPMHYLNYAFAKPVLETFRSLYRREPCCTEDDYMRIRQIRGGFYTEFMREGKAIADSFGKKFMFELESGAEIPDRFHSRMQLPMEWEKWISEGIADEVRLKYFTAHSRFVHQNVMPLCRKGKIPVQLISRCLHTGIGLRWREIWTTLIKDALNSGFAGYCLYEQQNLMDMTRDGHVILKGPLKELGKLTKVLLD